MNSLDFLFFFVVLFLFLRFSLTLKEFEVFNCNRYTSYGAPWTTFTEFRRQFIHSTKPLAFQQFYVDIDKQQLEKELLHRSSSTRTPHTQAIDKMYQTLGE